MGFLWNKRQPKEGLVEVELSELTVNPHQPRTVFSNDEMDELAASIEAVGLIQPPIVRFNAETEHYELVAGERRFRACERLGWSKIPVIVRQTDATLSAEAALIENVQRVDLNPLEIAHALRELTSEFAYSQDELAQRVGKKRSTVANYLRLLSLPEEIQNSLSAGKITMGHAKVLLSITDSDEQKQLYEKIVDAQLTVREAEDGAGVVEGKPKIKKVSKREKTDPFLNDVQERVQQRLGTKVKVAGRGKKGRISIDYYSLEDLDRVLEILGVEAGQTV